MAERVIFWETQLEARSRGLYPFQGTNRVLVVQNSPHAEGVSFGTPPKILSIFLSLSGNDGPLFQQEVSSGGGGPTLRAPPY